MLHAALCWVIADARPNLRLRLLRLHGVTMRNLSHDLAHLSINTATVRKQLALPAIIEACARRGIGAIDPWRDQVQAAGLERIARQVKDAGLALSGYCRGGFFPAAD